MRILLFSTYLGLSRGIGADRQTDSVTTDHLRDNRPIARTVRDAIGLLSQSRSVGHASGLSLSPNDQREAQIGRK